MNRVRIAAISRVCIASTEPFGTSRRGSIDSSAASGTSSIARKNQIANGSDLKIPLMPNGKPWTSAAGSGSPPPSGMLTSRLGWIFPDTIAAT